MRRLFMAWAVVFLWAAPVWGQADEPPLITAENIHHLHSVQQVDFADLPAEIVPASGLFAVDADASHLVTLGNLANDPPLSQAILWVDGAINAINRIDDSSLMRFLSDDGNCLYVGYRGYYAVYQFDPTSPNAIEAYRSSYFGDDVSILNLWGDTASCGLDLYAEIVRDDGTQSVIGPDGAVLYPDLFGQEAAARIGRIPPPLALTVDFDGNLYRWDMQIHEVTATVELGDLGMFGSSNPSGSHYVWLQTDYSGLQLVDFAAGTTRLIAELDATYISHIKLTHQADVILGVDPRDQPGTISAWLVETGERLELGAFRTCERVQPDLVQLTTDGTTLVIGCDTGLDLWQAG
ncbi:MAG: hypothetical protein H6673_15945 [Anaerolineales bacterium]|nr:hypothetical protein [Anaerolineales bacterium]